MPLLLRPAQSVGLVVRKAGLVARNTAAVGEGVAAANVERATSFGNNFALPGGAATLIDESRAEVLLSLVHLGASGGG